MLWVSELTGARWPPCADVRLRWTRYLVFIYIYDHGHPSTCSTVIQLLWTIWSHDSVNHSHTHTQLCCFFVSAVISMCMVCVCAGVQCVYGVCVCVCVCVCVYTVCVWC